jgi:hypothetical protein
MRPRLLPPDLKVLNLDSASERNLVLGYICEQRGDVAAALEYFRQVDGPSAPPAAAEIAKIQAHDPIQK